MIVTSVLDAVSGPANAHDPRTRSLHHRDALQEAMRRLLVARLWSGRG